MSSVNLSSSDVSSLLGSSTTSTTSSNGIDLSSLLQVSTGSSAAGIDVTAAVNAALTAARGPEVQWKAQQTTIQSQETDLKTLSSQTTAIENDLYSLDSSFVGLTTSSTNSSIASATSSAAASPGTHVVVVTSLATTASWYSSASVADANTGLSAGSFSLQVGGGTATPITVTSGETLSQLASAITGLNVGVKASVISDASGSRLSIVSTTSGSASDITMNNTAPQVTKATDGSAWNTGSVSDATGFAASGSFSVQVGSGTAAQITVTSGESLSTLATDINTKNPGVTASVVSDGGGSSHLAIVNNGTGTASGMTVTNTAPQFTQAAAGKNASLTVDDVPVSSATNTVTGAVTGMTINLNSASPGTVVTISATSNTSGITAAINQFVTDYNTLVGNVNTEYTYSASTSTASPLAGDSTLGLLQDALLGSGSYSDTSNGAFSTLGALGITMNNDGTLTVNSSTLNSAVQNNSAAVQQLFEGTAFNGFSSSLNKQLQNLTNPGSGAFSVDLSSMQTTYNSLTSQINSFEDNYIANLKSKLTAEYNAAEIALQNVQTTKQQINAELGNNTSSGN